MREPADAVRVIELLAPDDEAWAASPPAEPVRRPTGRRVFIAVAAVAAVIGIGVGVAIHEADERADETPAGADSEFFVVDGPGLRAYSADVVTAPDPDERFVLWTSGNATRPWVSVQLSRSADEPPAFLNSTRRVVDGRELTSPRDRLSTTEMVVKLDERWTALIRAFDVDDRALIAFADTVQVGQGSVMADVGVFGGPPLAPTATARTADELLHGQVTTQMRSLTSDGRMLTLRVADGQPGGDTRAATLPFFTTGLTAGDAERVAGTLTGSGDAVVLWSVGGHVLSLTGPASTRELLAVSRTVRPAPETEWRRLFYGLRPDQLFGDYVAVAEGVAGDGTRWVAGVQPAQGGGRTSHRWWWTRPGSPRTWSAVATAADLTTTPTAETVVVGGTTYVFVSTPSIGAADGVAPTATVRDANGAVVEVVLQQPFPDAPLLVAATRVDVPGRIEVTFQGSVTLSL